MVRKPGDFAHERRVLEILAEVLETPPPDRVRLLDERTAGDAGLRERLERLVALEARGELERDPGLPGVADFEQAGADGAADGAQADWPAPRRGGRIGSYEIVRPIAQGGMGQVFEALQDEPRRRVALKILRLGLDSDSARRRFRLESEVVAQLRHPGIAQVYEAGTHREESALGLREIPFFALEYVEDARTILDYARAHELTVDERVDLFLDVCDAVQHGHDLGIVHRDLKPANILVDSRGAPKVIDFGVARVLNREIGTTTRETLPGQLVGTVQYMSPEQLEAREADLDARCDVYSLGVVLFELLCGQPPFDVGDRPIAGVILAILESTPPRPRRLRPRLAADLEAVVLRALEKDRERRYAGVRELADDLRRYRRSEPVRATVPGLLHRARLFARRKRTALAGLVAVALVLALGTATSTFFARRSEAALDKAETFESALLEFHNEMTLNVLQQMAEEGVSAESRATLLRAATGRLEALAEARSEPDIDLSLASAYVRLGGLLGTDSAPNLRMPEESRRAYERARELLTALLEEDPENPSSNHYMAVVEVGLADLARARGEAQTATQYLADARERLEALLAREPESAEACDALALVVYRCIRNLHGDFDGMLAALDRAEELWARSAASRPLARSSARYRGMGASTRGSILLALGRFEEALAPLELGYELLRGVHLELPDQLASTANLVSVARDFSRALQYAGELDGAVEIAESVLPVSGVLLEGAESASVGQKAIGIRLQLARALLARTREREPGSDEFESDVERAAEQLSTAEEQLERTFGGTEPRWLPSLRGQVEELLRELDAVVARDVGSD